MANSGHRGVQASYDHLLLFRGQGSGVREEGLRLLRLAASAGDGKAAYQLGVQALRGDSRQASDALTASRHWALAVEVGYPLVACKLAELYRDGGPGLAPDSEHAEHYTQWASVLGL